MAKKVFISYSHHQGDWVRDSLYSALKAGGAKVLIDVDRFKAGHAVYQQMDDAQDQAEVQLLVFSPQYLASPPCRHEMDRAIAKDPAFSTGTIIPVLREDRTLPSSITTANPLWVNLKNPNDAAQWKLLLDACGVDLGTDAPSWLTVLRKVRSWLEQSQSVNLRVTGTVEWRGLLNLLDLPQLDLNSGATAGRRELISAILQACGHDPKVGPEPHDLSDFQTRLGNSPRPATLILRHFDRAKDRPYGDDFYWALNHLLENRKLVLVIQSRELLASLVPPALLQSGFASRTKVAELRGK